MVVYIMADIGHKVRIAYQTLQKHCNIARKPSGRYSQWLTSLADSWFAHNTIETNSFSLVSSSSNPGIEVYPTLILKSDPPYVP